MIELTETRRHDILVRLATIQRLVAEVIEADVDEDSLHRICRIEANATQARRILENGSPNRPPKTL